MKTRRRGRPAKLNTDEQWIETNVWRIGLELTRDEPAILQARKREGTFVLISNVDSSRKSDEQLLVDYKSQIQVENLFRAVKQPFLMHGIYLKSPKRVQAIAYVLLLALLVYALLQQRVRLGMKTESKPLVLNGVKIASPTGRTILEEFEDVIHVIVHLPDGQVSHRLDGITEGAMRMLKWLHLERREMLRAVGLPETG